MAGCLKFVTKEQRTKMPSGLVHYVVQVGNAPWKYRVTFEIRNEKTKNNNTDVSELQLKHSTAQRAIADIFSLRPSSGQGHVGWWYVPFVPVNFVQTQSGLGHFEERHLRCLSHSSCLMDEAWRTTKVMSSPNNNKGLSMGKGWMSVLVQSMEVGQQRVFLRCYDVRGHDVSELIERSLWKKLIRCHTTTVEMTVDTLHLWNAFS